jgi:flagellin
MINDSSFIRRSLNNSMLQLNNALERLSSGKRINKAKDDAAGLAIAAQLAANVSISLQGNRNAADAQSALQIADGSMSQLNNISTRMQELAAQSANGVLSDEQRQTLQTEYSQLSQEVQRITATTEFNGQKLLQDEGFTVQVGGDASADSQINVSGLDVNSLTSQMVSQDISTQAGAQAAMTEINTAIQNLSSARGSIGAITARLDAASSNNSTKAENEMTARSRIEDADIATEVANSTAARIRTQTAPALMAQSGRLNADIVLKLLS